MVFGKLIKKAIARKAGSFSATAMVAKGAQPVVDIGVIAGIAVAICKAAGIDIDEKIISEIMAGAVAAHSLFLMLRNYFKNKNK